MMVTASRMRRGSRKNTSGDITGNDDDEASASGEANRKENERRFIFLFPIPSAISDCHCVSSSPSLI
jgi:hypothetical protein